MIVVPPESTGAYQVIVIESLVLVCFARFIGSVGTTAAIKVDDASDAVPSPIAFLATTLNR